MMKRTVVVQMLLAAMLLSASVAWAVDEGRRERPEGKGRLDALIVRIDKALDLDETKLAQVEQIITTHMQAVKNWHQENADAHKALREEFAAAKKAGDKDAMKAVMEKRKKLMAGGKDLHGALVKNLGAALTEEQIKKITPLLRSPHGGGKGTPQNPLGHILGALRRLDLTEDQKGDVKEIMSGLKKAMEEAETREAKAEIAAATAKKLRALLTEEQLAALEKMKQRGGKDGPKGGRKPGAIFAGLDLNEDQQAALKKIHEDFMTAIKAAKTREEKMAAMKARHEAVSGVLSKEQMEKLRQRMRGQHRGKGPGGKGPGGKGPGGKGPGPGGRKRGGAGGGRPE